MYCNCDFALDPYFYMDMLDIPYEYYYYLKNEDDDFIQRVYSDVYSKIYPYVSKCFMSLTSKDLPVSRSLLEYLVNNIINDIGIDENCDNHYIPSYHEHSRHKISSQNLIRNIVSAVLVKEILYKHYIHNN